MFIILLVYHLSSDYCHKQCMVYSQLFNESLVVYWRHKMQVYVLCAIGRVGNVFTELTCKCRMKHTDLEK